MAAHFGRIKRMVVVALILGVALGRQLEDGPLDRTHEGRVVRMCWFSLKWNEGAFR